MSEFQLSFVVLIRGNSNSIHLGVQSTFKPGWEPPGPKLAPRGLKGGRPPSNGGPDPFERRAGPRGQTPVATVEKPPVVKEAEPL